MTTTWNATATVTQSEQLANAYASFTFSTGSSPVTHTIATATSYVTLWSVVFVANAWLSPGSGGSGSLKGKTHAGSAVLSVWSPASGRVESVGTRTSASCGSASVGNRPESGSTVSISPPRTGVGSAGLYPTAASGPAPAFSSVPPSYGRMGS